LKGANVDDELSATQVKKLFEVFEQTYGRRPVNQDEMVMWLKSSEYRAAIRPHLDAAGNHRLTTPAREISRPECSLPCRRPPTAPAWS
jgi:hypothetical protein